jgi:two-component system CheB/CheR fusion protein
MHKDAPRPEATERATAFFRDRDALAAFERAVVPLLFAGKTAGDAVRVWVACCDSGEEAYTLLMLLLEHAAQIPHPPSIKVFATDIDGAALKRARAGCYPKALTANVSPARLRRFFTQDPGGYCISTDVRDRVVFATHNLISDPPFYHLDLISCRNLLRCLSREAHEQVFDRFHFALRPGGFLFLGSAEAPETVRGQFTPADMRHGLFYASAPATRPVSALALQPAGRHSERMGEQRQLALSGLHQRMLERHTSPSLVVNTAYEIVHLPEKAAPFMQVPNGALSFNVLHMVHPELRGELHSALVEAFQTGQPATPRRARLVRDGRALSVTVHVHPQHDPALGAWFALVRFAAVEAGPHGVGTPGEDEVEASHARQLEADVRRLQRRLDEAAAAHDAMVEALQATNEELLATNEELRVTTEELETSKEELQSVNEELRTVNHELNHRVDELSAANDDLSNLMAASAITTVFLDHRLRITFYTPQASTLFNLIHADEGRPLAHIAHHLDYPDLLADAQAVLGSAQPVEHEVGDGKGRHYLARIVPYRSRRERTDGVVLTFVDISARRQAEAELARAYEAEQAARIAAERALQTRDQFLSIASHELRTPMTTLLGYAQLLPKALVRGTGDLTKMTERIARQALRLNGLIDQLLDVSRLQRGQFAIERQPIDIAALGTMVVSEFRDTLPPDTASAVALVRPESPVLVMGDAARLEQVLLNLLSNAVKYNSPGGSVQVQIAHTAAEVVVEVTDQGIGIPAQVQDQLFTPFYRAPNVGPHASGFGLGLYIAREIVQRHSGRVEVTSTEGAGSTFRVILPRHETGEARALGADPGPR